MIAEGKDAPAPERAVRYIEVDEGGAGQRVDNFLLSHLKGVPKSHIYRILRSGEVRVNSGRVDASRKLALGDRIRIPPIRVAEREAGDAPAPALELPILFEDEHILAVDKPAGLAVHGGSGIAHGAIERLRAGRPQAKFLELVHRLDRETSGVLLLAKKRAALTALHEDLRERAMDKRYLAAVAGRVRDKMRRVKVALAQVLDGGGRAARGRRRAGGAGRRDRLPPASRATTSSASWRPSSSPGAPTRSASTSRTSGIRSSATRSTGISRSTRRCASAASSACSCTRRSFPSSTRPRASA